MSGYLDHKMSQTMSRILEVRYTDLDEERRLCEKLLVWAQKHKDDYAEAFAYTYLGDCHIAVYDEEKAGRCLLEAQKRFKDTPDWDDLRLRVYGFFAIYYEIRADEQSAINYYLKAIAVAERLNDVEGECAVLNNLAFAFQRCRCYEEALTYYKKAYYLQEPLEKYSSRCALLTNLVDILLLMHRYEEAKKYIEECAQAEENPERRKAIEYKNLCCYYASAGEKEKALTYARLLWENRHVIDEDPFSAFENYHILYRHMMDLGDKQYAGCFLRAMDETSAGNGLDQMQALEDAFIRYTLLFDPPSEHPKAYRRFYERNQKFRKKANEMIVGALKSQIELDQLMQQTKQMQSKQQALEGEVNFDALTGTYSRNFLEKQMREASSRQEGETLGIVIMDMDYLKEYNDFYGHLKGDVVLTEIGNCLMESRTEQIYPCRYGGDEFVCICAGVPEQALEDYIQRVRASLHTKAIPHEKSMCINEVTLSIGYAFADKTASVEVHLLLQYADQALYQSKRSGRNTYTRKGEGVQ